MKMSRQCAGHFLLKKVIASLLIDFSKMDREASQSKIEQIGANVFKKTPFPKHSVSNQL